MSQIDHLIDRVNKLLDRIETTIPENRPVADLNEASAFRWCNTERQAFLEPIKNLSYVRLANLLFSRLGFVQLSGLDGG